MDANKLRNFVILLFLFDFHCSSCSGVVPLLKLNDGRDIPGFGIGTWLGTEKTKDLKGGEVQKAVEWAIDAGYRHIDTAAIYSTESQVGQAIKSKISQGVIKRGDVFLTTKLWNKSHKKENVLPALRESLKNLDLPYVDLYLVHWPVAQYANESLSDVDYLETWEGMIEALNQGLTKSIGVSNFNVAQLQRLISHTTVKPAVLQVEVNLNLQQPALLSYCKSQGIIVTAYTPFGTLFGSRAVPGAPAPRANDPRMLELAKKYNKSVAQIVLRYLVELDVIPIPKSLHKERVEENLQVFDFQLSADDFKLLKSFDVGYRTIVPAHWKDSIYYPFEK